MKTRSKNRMLPNLGFQYSAGKIRKAGLSTLTICALAITIVGGVASYELMSERSFGRTVAHAVSHYDASFSGFGTDQGVTPELHPAFYEMAPTGDQNCIQSGRSYSEAELHACDALAATALPVTYIEFDPSRNAPAIQQDANTL